MKAEDGSLRQERFHRVAGALKSLVCLEFLYRSPALLLAAVAISVVVSNAVVMMVLEQSNLAKHVMHHMLDSFLMVALIFPALILLVFRPIQLHLVRRTRAEDELGTERNKLRKILDAMPVGICIIDRSYRIEYTNTALLEEFGAVEGRSCREYFQGLPAPCPSCRIGQVLSGKTVTCELVSELTGKVYEVFETPLPNADGSSCKLAMVRDVTQRRMAEYELRASRQQLRSLSAHQQRTREEERTAVSREIHDELGQVLATVQLGVSSLAQEYQDHRHLTGKIQGMVQLITGAIGTIQKIATQLRPSILDELGLAEAVEWQSAEFSKRTAIACTPDILLRETSYDSSVATAVFRILQEALTNVIRHSGATRVAVSLEERNGRLVLIIADNGRGIRPEQLRESHSLGITGMRERAYALGGRVRLCRSPQQGTVVVAHIPVTPFRGDA